MRMKHNIDTIVDILRATDTHYTQGLIPKSLVGKIILKVESDPKSGRPVGYHWMEEQKFRTRYKPWKIRLGLLKDDVYLPSWRERGII